MFRILHVTFCRIDISLSRFKIAIQKHQVAIIQDDLVCIEAWIILWQQYYKLRSTISFCGYFC